MSFRERIIIGQRDDRFADAIGVWVSPPGKNVLRIPESECLLASSTDDITLQFLDKVTVQLAALRAGNASERTVRWPDDLLLQPPLVFAQAVAGNELIEPVMQRNTSLAIKTGTPPRYRITIETDKMVVRNQVERTYKLNLLIVAV